MSDVLIFEKIPKTLEVWRESKLGDMSFCEEDFGLVIRIKREGGYFEVTFNAAFIDEHPTTDASLALALKRILDAIVDQG